MWSVDGAPEVDTFPPEKTLHILRIIQEAVTNALRHAHADRIEVSVAFLEEGEGGLRIAIRDFGCGVSPGMSRDGRGIQNMRTRAEALGAAFRIEGAAPGTLIELRVPVPR